MLHNTQLPVVIAVAKRNLRDVNCSVNYCPILFFKSNIFDLLKSVNLVQVKKNRFLVKRFKMILHINCVVYIDKVIKSQKVTTTSINRFVSACH